MIGRLFAVLQGKGFMGWVLFSPCERTEESCTAKDDGGKIDKEMAMAAPATIGSGLVR